MDANQIMQTVTTIAIAFGVKSPALVVRPYCHTDHYWQVYFDTNKVIRESFEAAGFPVPEQHLVIRNGAGSAANT
jgi:small conductance mechanosensitive channel